MRDLRKNVLVKCLLSLVLGVAIGVNYHGEINSFVAEHSENAGYKVLPLDQDGSGTGKDSDIFLLKDKGGAGSGDSQLSYKPEITPCFTPPANCVSPITGAINKARSSIYVQAYGFTHPQIINALLEAQNRGVDVRVLLDRSNLSQKHSGIRALQKAGIETTIDIVPGIAHNKIMIIDEMVVVTGSFNFTKAAATRNAENILIIGDKAIARGYLGNWLYRRSLNNNHKGSR